MFYPTRVGMSREMTSARLSIQCLSHAGGNVSLLFTDPKYGNLFYPTYVGMSRWAGMI